MKKIKYSLYAALLLIIFAMGMIICNEDVSAKTVSGNCGIHATWELDTDSGVLSISGYGAMYNTPDGSLTSYDDYSYAVRSVIIHDGITRIGDRAFLCYDISSISIPSSVTTIGKQAFKGCNLISLSIPSSVTTLESEAFEGCMSLKWVTFSEGLKTIGEDAFFLTPLTSVTIPSTVTSIGKWAFVCCTGIKTTIPTLREVYIKNSKTSINKYAFSSFSSSSPSNANVIIYGFKGSTAEKYATKYKIGFRTFNTKIPSSTKITSLSQNKTRAKTKLKFTKVSGAYQYEIQISKVKDFHDIVLQAFVKKTALNLGGISSSFVNKTVYIRVRAYKKTAGKISVSNWSTVKKTKMKK